MLFSQRKGLKPVKSVIQTDSMDVALRNGLWNVLIKCYWNQVQERVLSDNSYDLQTLFQRIWEGYFGHTLDTLPAQWDRIYPNDRAFYPIIREHFFKGTWNEVYDFVEFVYNKYGEDEVYEALVNDVLTRELSAYRLIGGRIVEITAEEELNEVEQALKTPLELVNHHMKSALGFLADRNSPDYRNSMKESISAVEAMCQSISGTTKTLDKALDEIERRGKVKIHRSLKDAFSKLYGYTGDAEGIRHAMKDEPTVEFEDAKFMLVSCSAFINYLLAKMVRAGNSPR